MFDNNASPIYSFKKMSKMLRNYFILMHPCVVFDLNVLKLYCIIFKLVFKINRTFYKFSVINLFFYDSLVPKHMNITVKITMYFIIIHYNECIL